MVGPGEDPLGVLLKRHGSGGLSGNTCAGRTPWGAGPRRLPQTGWHPAVGPHPSLPRRHPATDSRRGCGGPFAGVPPSIAEPPSGSGPAGPAGEILMMIRPPLRWAAATLQDPKPGAAAAGAGGRSWPWRGRIAGVRPPSIVEISGSGCGAARPALSAPSSIGPGGRPRGGPQSKSPRRRGRAPAAAATGRQTGVPGSIGERAPPDGTRQRQEYAPVNVQGFGPGLT